VNSASTTFSNKDSIGDTFTAVKIASNGLTVSDSTIYQTTVIALHPTSSFFIPNVSFYNGIYIKDPTTYQSTTIEQVGTAINIKNTTNGTINFSVSLGTGAYNIPLYITSSDVNCNSYLYFRDGVYGTTYNSSIRHENAYYLAIRNEVDNGFITFQTKTSLGSIATRFEINDIESKFYNNVVIDGSLSIGNDLDMNSHKITELEQITFTSSYGGIGPNKIILYPSYGFGVDGNTLKYCSFKDHKFYYNTSDITNGTLQFTIGETESIFYYDLYITGDVTSPLDVKTTALASSASSSFSITDTGTTNSLGMYISLAAGNYNPFVRLDSTAIIAGGLLDSKKLFLGTHSNTSSGILIEHNVITIGAGGTGTTPTLYFQSYAPDNRNFIVGNTDITGGLRFKDTGTTKSTTMNTASNGDFVIEANDTDSIIYFYTNTSSSQINSMTIKTTQVDFGVNININDGKLLVFDNISSDVPNKIVLFDNGTSGRYGFGVGTDYNTAYCVGGSTLGKHKFYVGSTSSSNGTEKFRIENLKSTFYNDLYITGDVTSPLDVKTTALASSANSSFSITDTGTTNSLGMYISLGAGNYNPYVSSNNIAIIAGGVVNTNTLFLGVHSDTSSGIKLTHNEAVMGAGGSGAAPTLYFQSSGPNNKNYIQGNTNVTGDLNVSGSINSTTNNTGVGDWIGTPATINGGYGTPVLNYIYFTPIRVQRTMSITQLGVPVVAGFTGASVRFLIYSNNPATGKPNAILQDRSVTLASQASATIASTGTLATTITLSAGFYWLGFCRTSGTASNFYKYATSTICSPDFAVYNGDGNPQTMYRYLTNGVNMPSSITATSLESVIQSTLCLMYVNS
jgi:hypothetical protein